MKPVKAIKAWAVIDEETGSFMIPINCKHSQEVPQLPVAFKDNHIPLLIGEKLIRVEIKPLKKGSRRK